MGGCLGRALGEGGGSSSSASTGGGAAAAKKKKKMANGSGGSAMAPYEIARNGAPVFGYEQNFNQQWNLGKELGSGQFGTTFECTPAEKGRFNSTASKATTTTTTGTTTTDQAAAAAAAAPPPPPLFGYAVKIIPKKILNSKDAVGDVKREVSIMDTLAGVSQNIVRFYAAYEDDGAIYLVMERCIGGELFDRIINLPKGHFSESDAAAIVRQMLQVVAKCHLNGVIHRDLKPENFLYHCADDTSDAQCLKATDFGLSEYFVDKQMFHDVVGSAYYVAPEVLKRRYGPEADVWSIGVIMYILLSGTPPFWAQTEAGIFNEILKGKKPNMTAPPWNKISQSAKKVLCQLLEHDPRQRLTAAQALTTPWVREDGDAPTVPLDHTILSSIRDFATYGKLKQAVLEQIASTFDDSEIRDLRDQFLIMDEDGDGLITVEEMLSATKKMRTGDGGRAVFSDDDEVLRMLKAMDANGDGVIDYMEFVAATMRLNQIQRGEHRDGWKRRVKLVFDKFDMDGNGLIDRSEVAQMFGLDGTDDALDAMIAEADKNNDGFIDYQELLDLLRQDANRKSVKKMKSQTSSGSD
ncbi:calcium-dependent protein kinase [Pseudoscourfieldia marina]